MANGSRNRLAPTEKPLDETEMCGARLTSKEGTCRKMKGSGTPHPGFGYCSKHGGNTEAGLKAGARDAGRYFIDRYKRDDPQRFRFGGDRNDPDIARLTPELALLEEVRRSAAMVRFLEQRIGEWGMDLGDPALDNFVKGTRYTDPENRKVMDQYLRQLPADDPDSPAHLPDLVNVHPDTGVASFTNRREWLYLYREERGHLARVAKMALDAGVAARLVSLAEDQGRMLSSALRLTLQALHLSEEQQQMVPLIVPQILRAVASNRPLPSLDALLGSPAPAATPLSITSG